MTNKPQDTPSRKLDKYIVRMPDGMREDLKAAARSNGRSLNQEIIMRLTVAERTMLYETETLPVAAPKQTDPQFKLRLPLDLKSAIEEAAEANNRSMNAEIVSALERHIGVSVAKEKADMIDEAMKRIRDELVRLVS